MDSKGNRKAIHVELPIRSEAAVERAKLFYRQPGEAKYWEQGLKLNHELIYAASIPYSERIEYFVLVSPERGADFILGSNANPQIIHAEDLPTVPEVKQGKLKKILIDCGVVAAAVIAGLLGAGTTGSSKKK